MIFRIPARYQYLLAFVLTAISVLVAYDLLMPRYRDLAADEARLDHTQEVARGTRELIAEESQQKVGPIVASLPADRNEPVRFLRDMSTLAANSGVRFTNLAAATSPTDSPFPWSAGGADAARNADPKVKLPPGVSPVSLQVSVEGPYPALARFFNGMETYPRLISVSNVTMNSNQYPKLTAQFRLTRYIGPAPPNI